MCEKEKLLVTSNFSFSYCVFKRHDWQTLKTSHGLFEKWVKHGLRYNNLFSIAVPFFSSSTNAKMFIVTSIFVIISHHFFISRYHVCSSDRQCDRVFPHLVILCYISLDQKQTQSQALTRTVPF